MQRLLNADPVEVPTGGVVYSPPQLVESVVPMWPQPQAFDLEGIVQAWVVLNVEGDAPAAEAFLGWSDSGWSVDEFEWADEAAIICEGPGRFSLPILALQGRYLAVRLEGGPGNGLDTVITVSCGGTC